ncbi:MAG: hypothetical protein ACYS26_10475 [Planctomycetota bacterium]
MTALNAAPLALLQQSESEPLKMLLQLVLLAFFFLGPLLNRKKDDGKGGKPARKSPKPSKSSRPSDAEERGGDLWRQLLDLDPEPERPSPPASSDPNVPELLRPVTQASAPSAAPSRAKSKLPPSPPKRSKPKPAPRREPLSPTPSESELESGAGQEDAWAEAGRGFEDRLEAGGSPEERLEMGSSSEEALERGGGVQREALTELSGLTSRSLSESVTGAEVDDLSDDPREQARRASWRAAIVAAEVLGRPVALRDSDAEGPLGLR